MLTPGIGLHHSNRGKAFALAEDLVEPFHLLVECTFNWLAARTGTEVYIEAKQQLARCLVSIALSRRASFHWP